MMRNARLGLVVVVSAAVISATGCVRRTLTIRTEPAGGQVYLNGEEVGTSPVTVDFTWYGDYDVEVHKEGFATLKSNFVTPAPWYQFPPFDFVAEVLYPGHVVDVHEASFTLEPAQPVLRDDLIARARELQSLSRGGKGAMEPAIPSEVEAAPASPDAGTETTDTPPPGAESAPPSGAVDNVP